MRQDWTSTEKLILSSLIPTEASQHRLRRLLTEQRERIDWEEVARRGEYLLLLPLMRYNLARARLLQTLPEDLQNLLREQAETAAAREMIFVSEARRLVSVLQSHGIESLPLKGVALMLGGYYPQPGLRAALDIDLIIPPDRLDEADALLEKYGYPHLPGRRSLRERQRLANERNHLWPRRSPKGVVVELHHRAFQFAQLERNFGFDDLWYLARTVEAGFLPLPAPADLSIHLIHHTLVDLQSGHAILRTISDLHFIFEKYPKSIEMMRQRGARFGFPGSISLAEQAVRHISLANLEALKVDEAYPDLGMLLKTALLPSHDQFAEAARIIEYLDFSHRPAQKAGNIVSLLFPTKAHMGQLYEKPAGSTNQTPRGILLKYLRRPVDLLTKIDWQSLRPSTLRLVRRWRRVPTRKPDHN